MDEGQTERPSESDRVKPWTIKGIAWAKRNAAIAAAEKSGQTIGEWIADAIVQKIQEDRRKAKTPLVILGQTEPVRPSDPAADIEEIERLVGILRDARELGDVPTPTKTIRLANAMVGKRLRAIDAAGRTQKAQKSDQEAA